MNWIEYGALKYDGRIAVVSRLVDKSRDGTPIRQFLLPSHLRCM